MVCVKNRHMSCGILNHVNPVQTFASSAKARLNPILFPQRIAQEARDIQENHLWTRLCPARDWTKVKNLTFPAMLTIWQEWAFPFSIRLHK